MLEKYSTDVRASFLNPVFTCIPDYPPLGSGASQAIFTYFTEETANVQR